MLAKLKSWAQGAAGGGTPAAAPEEDELATATALLLAEAASLDGDFDEGEAAAIGNLLTDRFGLTPEEAMSIVDQARAKADGHLELYGLTRTIKSHLEPDQRIAIMEMLWEVAYADGELHDFEAIMARRVAGLLHVPDRDSGTARKRVLARLERNANRA